nr:GNAT family protein [Maliibacterium massiliense]
MQTTQTPCTLRPWEMADAPALARALGNRRVQDNLRDGIPYPYGEQDARAFIAQMRAADPNAIFSFAISAGGRLAGSIAAFRQENIHFRTAELGYFVAEPFWGRGIATCAVGQLCAHVFAHSDILRIFAEPFACNAASCRVLEKCGFTREGTLRANAVKNGRVLDMHLYARVRTDARA